MGYKYRGQKLPMDKPFRDIEGTRYPSNWLRLSTQDARNKVPGGAIVWEPD